MIVPAEALAGLPRPVTMVDGGFDPLHPGHIDYFRAAAALGGALLCNISPDTWVERKHPVLLPQAERAAVIDAIRYVDYVHLASGSTEDVLRLLAPRFYAKGDDWRGRLPEGELQACTSLGTEVVFLATVSRSSTAIAGRFRSAPGRS